MESDPARPPARDAACQPETSARCSDAHRDEGCTHARRWPCAMAQCKGRGATPLSRPRDATGARAVTRNRSLGDDLCRRRASSCAGRASDTRARGTKGLASDVSGCPPRSVCCLLAAWRKRARAGVGRTVTEHAACGTRHARASAPLVFLGGAARGREKQGLRARGARGSHPGRRPIPLSLRVLVQQQRHRRDSG
jgi:hypothetical protein